MDMSSMRVGIIHPTVISTGTTVRTTYLGDVLSTRDGKVYGYRDGIIAETLADIGSTVQAGDPVARLVPATLSPDTANTIADKKSVKIKAEGSLGSAESSLQSAQDRRDRTAVATDDQIAASTQAFVRAQDRRKALVDTTSSSIDAATRALAAARDRRDRIGRAMILSVSGAQASVDTASTIRSSVTASTQDQIAKTIAEQDAKIAKTQADLDALDVSLQNQEGSIDNTKERSSVSVSLEQTKLQTQEKSLRTSIASAHNALNQVFYGSSHAGSTSTNAQGNIFNGKTFGERDVASATAFAAAFSKVSDRIANVDTISPDGLVILANDTLSTLDLGLHVLDNTLAKADYPESMLGSDKNTLIAAKTDSMNGLQTILNAYAEQKSMLAKEQGTAGADTSDTTLQLTKMQADRASMVKELAMDRAERDRMIAEVQTSATLSQNDALKMTTESKKNLVDSVSSRELSLIDADRMVTEAEKTLADTRASGQASLIDADRMIADAQRDLANAKASRELSLIDADRMIADAEKAKNDATADIASADAALSILDSGALGDIIRAPFSGKITRRNVNVGEAVTVSSPIFDIIQDGNSAPEVFVRYEVPESEIGGVRIGDAVSLSRVVEPLRVYTARVQRIAPAVDPTTRSVVVEAVVDTHDVENIPIGSSVRISVTSGTPLLMIPTVTVRQDTDGSTYVYVVESGRMAKKIVKTSRVLGDQITVLSGLATDDSVIVDDGGMPPAVGMAATTYLMSSLGTLSPSSTGAFDLGEHAGHHMKAGEVMDMSKPMDGMDMSGSTDSMSGMDMIK